MKTVLDMSKIYPRPDFFHTPRLVNKLLSYRWQHECEIIPEYTPPYPRGDTQPSCVVRYTNEKKQVRFLRYSKGPGTGTFWDVCGDDFLTTELALVELSKAAPPPGVNSIIPTHGDPYIPWAEDEKTS
jgi:hypothetical protein